MSWLQGFLTILAIISVRVCVHIIKHFISDDFKVSHKKKCLFKKTVGSKINFVNKNYGQQELLGQIKFWIKKALADIFFWLK